MLWTEDGKLSSCSPSQLPRLHSEGKCHLPVCGTKSKSCSLLPSPPPPPALPLSHTHYFCTYFNLQNVLFHPEIRKLRSCQVLATLKRKFQRVFSILWTWGRQQTMTERSGTVHLGSFHLLPIVAIEKIWGGGWGRGGIQHFPHQQNKEVHRRKSERRGETPVGLQAWIRGHKNEWKKNLGAKL